MVEAVDFVDKEHVVFVEIGQNGGEVARAVDGGAARYLDGRAELVGDNVRERGFAQAGGAVQKHVVERVPPHFARLYVDREIILDLLLSYIPLHVFGAEHVFYFVILELLCGHDKPFFFHITSSSSMRNPERP